MDEMNLLLIFVFMIFGFSGKPDISSSLKTTQNTLPIEQRIAILKHKIVDQIKQKNIDDSEVTVIDEEVEYEDRDNEPLTPINERDPRKKKELYKLKAIKTTPGLKKNYNDFDNFDVPERNFAKRGKAFERKASKVVGRNGTLPKSMKYKKPKITDVFYRRVLKDIGSHKWTHCQCLITPFITGHKTNITIIKTISYDDATVIRLIQLLTEDITGHSKDDIHSIMYQISNLQLRLFQWDVAAIKLLLNVINRNKVKRHTFKSIKYGLKEIFKSWKLNFGSNISLLMKQTRMFRPPCVVITRIGGSTKTSKTIRYTKATSKKRCHKRDKNYEECIRNERSAK